MSTEIKQVLVGMAAALGFVAFLTATVVTVHIYAGPQFLIAALGVVGGITVAAMQYRWGKRKEIEARHYPDKREVYIDLVSTIMSHFRSDEIEKTILEPNDLAKKFQDIRVKLLIWGSAKSVMAFDQLSGFADQSQPDLLVRGLIWNSKFLGAVRSDLGHADTPDEIMEMTLGMLLPADRELARTMLKTQKSAT